jgi:F-box protein 28
MTDSTSEFEEKMVLKMENQAANSQAQASSSGGDGKKITLLSLHDDVFQEILSHLSYDEIAKLRLV